VNSLMPVIDHTDAPLITHIDFRHRRSGVP
jgi:hypothetical protein